MPFSVLLLLNGVLFGVQLLLDFSKNKKYGMFLIRKNVKWCAIWNQEGSRGFNVAASESNEGLVFFKTLKLKKNISLFGFLFDVLFCFICKDLIIIYLVNSLWMVCHLVCILHLFVKILLLYIY